MATDFDPLARLRSESQKDDDHEMDMQHPAIVKEDTGAKWRHARRRLGDAGAILVGILIGVALVIGAGFVSRWLNG